MTRRFWETRMLAGIFMLTLLALPWLVVPQASNTFSTAAAMAVDPFDIARISGDSTYPDAFRVTNISGLTQVVAWELDCADPWDSDGVCDDRNGIVTLAPGASLVEGLGLICARWQLNLDWTSDGQWDWSGVAEPWCDIPRTAWSYQCAAYDVDITGAGMKNQNPQTLFIPDSFWSTIQVGGAGFEVLPPAAAELQSTSGTQFLTDPFVLSANENPSAVQPPGQLLGMMGYVFTTQGEPGEITATVTERWNWRATVEGIVAYYAAPTSMLYSGVGTTTLQYAWGGDNGQGAIGPARLELTLPEPLPVTMDVVVRAAIMEMNPDDRIAILRAEAGGVTVEEVFNAPDPGKNQLNLIILTLPAVPAGTATVLVELESPRTPAGGSQFDGRDRGDSVFLLGATVSHPCLLPDYPEATSTPTATLEPGVTTTVTSTSEPAVTSTPTPSATATPDPSATNTPVQTNTATATATHTAPATMTPAHTATSTPVVPTLTSTATSTPVVPTLTSTATSTPVVPTLTSTATSTPVVPTLTSTATSTPVVPTLTSTATSTPVVPTLTSTATSTPVVPTLTNTATNTPVPPPVTNTATNTPVPPPMTNTATNTPVVPTLTSTATSTPVVPTLTSTATSTPVVPTLTSTATNTPVVPTLTSTATATFTPTSTPVLTGRIGDLVWEDDNWNGERESWEYGAIEVPVKLFRRDADGIFRLYRTTLTDWDGQYLFSDIPAGRYYVAIDLANSQWYQRWFSTTDNPYGPFSLAPGQIFLDADFGISYSGS